MQPLVFEPYLRPMVWGGRRLGELFGKRLPAEGTFGESWEVSAHRHHVSRVAEGPHAGRSLAELCDGLAAALFGGAAPAGGFPLLVKLLDCNDLLSVQVHPTDELAARLAPGELGKTEAWVVLAAEPGACIYAGLRRGVGRAELEHHLAAGTVEQCLHRLAPRPGDCIFLEAGTVHAVGGGVVIAEVQQTSDATFRLFDWNRVGPDGSRRELHLEQALGSIDFDRGPVAPARPEPLPGLPEGARGERLVRCRYFTMDRYHLAGPLDLPPAGAATVWVVLEGAAELRAESCDYRRRFARGEAVLVPAACGALTWVPGPEGATLLRAGVG